MASVFSGGSSRPLIKLALGRGKKAKALLTVEPLADIVAELKRLPREISTKYQLRALRRAAKPGQEALLRNVAALGQVTGNLLASVTKAERKYTNNRQNLPIGVVVVGFRRPVNSSSQKGATPAFAGGSVLKGPNRAYHSHLVEFGTGPRSAGKSKRGKRRRVILGGRIRTIQDRAKQQPEGNPRGILSSWKTRGSFSGRGFYPVDFIATGPVRPSPARRPLARAFQSSETTMKSILDAEMRKSLAAAVRESMKQYGDFGTS
jgi:hypothetical protein